MIYVFETLLARATVMIEITAITEKGRIKFVPVVSNRMITCINNLPTVSNNQHHRRRYCVQNTIRGNIVVVGHSVMDQEIII